MKITCLALCLLGLAALVSADGEFVPRAYYTLDSEGHKSNVHEINPNAQGTILRRIRRQPIGSSSSASSSTFTSNDGGPTYYEQHSVVQNAAPQLFSRFSGDDDYEDQGYGVIGHAVHTSGAIHNGQVLYHKTTHQKL